MLRNFRGYQVFIPSLATIATPSTDMLQRGVPWNWNIQSQDAFDHSKQALMSAQLLAHCDPQKENILTVDASATGVGAVISHKLAEGDRPIAYASRTPNHAEQRYSSIERERLAIIFGIGKFHQYLYARKFILVTDHKPLTWIFSPTKGILVLVASRLQRWAIQLSAYQYEIRYRSSRQNANADILS